MLNLCNMSALLRVLVALFSYRKCQAFAPYTRQQKKVMHHRHHDRHHFKFKISKPIQHNIPSYTSPSTSSTTTLQNGVIIDVDDNFFTAAFFSIGLFYSLGKAYNRYLLEEVAFEQRKFEARERRLASDPTLSELDVRREESASWPSVYGRKFRGEGETVESSEERNGSNKRSKRRGSVSVLDREDDELDEDEFNSKIMSDEEIKTFETTYGVEYDPYYDEPYEESELPVGKYKEDKSYGDRRYENGEVFYKDEASGLFYRQGSRPRQKKFWDMNSS